MRVNRRLAAIPVDPAKRIHPAYSIEQCPKCGFEEADGGYCPKCGWQTSYFAGPGWVCRLVGCKIHIHRQEI